MSNRILLVASVKIMLMAFTVAFVVAACAPESPQVPDETHGLAGPVEVVCMHGVQYYQTDILGNGVVGIALAPKYSPGVRYPDTCP